MLHEYVGKPYKDGHEICMVIDTEIATGDALVYNRHTNVVEVIPYGTWVNVDSNLHRLYQDTEESYEKDYQRACKKYADVIKDFEQRDWYTDGRGADKPADEPATDTTSSVLGALESAESREAATEYLKAQKLTKAQVTEISRAAGVYFRAGDTKQALLDRLVETVVGMRLAHEALLRVSW